MKSFPFLVRHEGVPHVDWKRAFMAVKGKPAKKREADFNSIVKDWLSVLAKETGTGNRTYESKWIFYSTYFPPRIAEERLGTIIDVKNALLGAFGDVIPDTALGKNLILEFEDLDMYYRYLSYFYDRNVNWKRKTIPQSGGVCIGSGGYLHILLNVYAKAQLSRIIAHELSHNLLAWYQLPSWLSEGIAVNAESMFSGRSQLYLGDEMVEKHREYWNESKFSKFLKGETIRGPRTVQLAYGLSNMMVREMIHKRVRLDLVLKKYKEGGDISAAIKDVTGREPAEFAPPMVRKKILAGKEMG